MSDHKFHVPKSRITASGLSLASEPGAPCGQCGGTICDHYDKASGYACRLLVLHESDHANNYGSWKQAANVH